MAEVVMWKVNREVTVVEAVHYHDLQKRLEAVCKAASKVLSYDWSDCDEDARKDIEKLRSVVNGS